MGLQQTAKCTEAQQEGWTSEESAHTVAKQETRVQRKTAGLHLLLPLAVLREPLATLLGKALQRAGRRGALDDLRRLLLKVADELGVLVNLALDLVDEVSEELVPTVEGRSDQGQAHQHAPASGDRLVQVAGEDLALVVLDLIEHGSQRVVLEALAHIPEICAQDLRQRMEA